MHPIDVPSHAHPMLLFLSFVTRYYRSGVKIHDDIGDMGDMGDMGHLGHLGHLGHME